MPYMDGVWVIPLPFWFLWRGLPKISNSNVVFATLLWGFWRPNFGVFSPTPFETYASEFRQIGSWIPVWKWGGHWIAVWFLNHLPDFNLKIEAAVRVQPHLRLNDPSCEVKHILGAEIAAWFSITVWWSPLKKNAGDAMVRCFSMQKGTHETKSCKCSDNNPATLPDGDASVTQPCTNVSNLSQIPWQTNMLPSNKIHLAKFIICEQSIFWDKPCKYDCPHLLSPNCQLRQLFSTCISFCHFGTCFWSSMNSPFAVSRM